MKVTSMTDLIVASRTYLDTLALPEATPAKQPDAVLAEPAFATLLDALIAAPAFSRELGSAFAKVDAVEAITPARMLRSALNLPVTQVFAYLARVFAAVATSEQQEQVLVWKTLEQALSGDTNLARTKLLEYLTTRAPAIAVREHYRDLADRLVTDNPHALYPTSAYRMSDGHVESSADERTVEAVMNVSTFSSIKVVDRVLEPDNPTLRDIYHPLGRCVTFIDENVDAHYGEALDA